MPKAGSGTPAMLYTETKSALAMTAQTEPEFVDQLGYHDPGIAALVGTVLHDLRTVADEDT
jgi:hypothetical protein